MMSVVQKKNKNNNNNKSEYDVFRGTSLTFLDHDIIAHVNMYNYTKRLDLYVNNWTVINTFGEI